VRSASRLSVGLDIGATKIHGVVVDDAGNIQAEARAATQSGAEGVLASAVGVVDELRDAVDLHITGTVGVGIPGLVDTERGTVSFAVNLDIAGPVLLADRLSERLGLPVAIENDLNAATLGAWHASGTDDLAYLSFGTGLAAGLVLDGKLRRGVHAAAGEIGHIPVDPAGERCHCGQRGCLETIASGSALTRMWPSSDAYPVASLFAAADAGDEKATLVRDRFVGGAADAVRLVALAVDPATILLGGGVTHLGEPFVAAVREALRASAASSDFLASLRLPERLRLVPTDLPVAALGAAMVGRRAQP